MTQQTFSRSDLIKLLASATCHHPFIVAIDGCGGAGKSTFSELLAVELKAALAEVLAELSEQTVPVPDLALATSADLDDFLSESPDGAADGVADYDADDDAVPFTFVAERLPVEVHIIKMDDFYKPSRERLPQREAEALIGSDYDWQRLRSQVLQPLIHSRPVSYQRYDWDDDALAEWHDVPLNSIVIIEGCYSLRHELTFFYDLTCWVYCGRDLRLARGIARDGEAKRHIWEKYWMPAEERYIEMEEPHRRANLLIDGSGATESISARCDLNALFTPRDH